VPPTNRPLPRFLAEPPLEHEPHGRWAERLAGPFAEACAEAGVDAVEAADIAWFPQRAWGGRAYVPATVGVTGGGELFGYVSYVPAADGAEPDAFEARAELTTETAASNPDWLIDLSDEVIGAWRGTGGTRADVTLVWGVPMRAGVAVATAELDGETVDQCEIAHGGRFTLLALDAVEGFGDVGYLEVAIWDRRGSLLGIESLYEREESEESAS
jgi:hypothetical protein